mgnify:FL=1
MLTQLRKMLTHFRVPFHISVNNGIEELVFGVLVPTCGYLADRYGIRKRIMIAGFLFFSSGLLLVGLSVSYTMILLAWFIYGLLIALMLSGALLKISWMPSSRSLVRNTPASHPVWFSWSTMRILPVQARPSMPKILR